MRAQLSAFILTMTLTLVGCSIGQSDQEYVASFNKICKEYGAYGATLQNQKVPGGPGMSREARVAAISRSVRDTGDRFAALQKEQEALVAPDKYAGLQAAAVNFYRVQADDWHQWSDAIARDDQTTADQLSQKVSADTIAQLNALGGEAQKLGDEDPTLAQSIKDLQQSQSQSDS